MNLSMAFRISSALCGVILISIAICNDSRNEGIIYVDVDIKQIKGDHKDAGLNLSITSNTLRKTFHFQLSRKHERRLDIPIFFMATDGIRKSIMINQKVKTAYHDNKNKALFYVSDGENNTASITMGFFASERFLYTLKSKRIKSALKYYLVKNDLATLNEKHLKETEESDTLYLPKIKKLTSQKSKRQTILYEIELFLAIDHSIYEVLARDFLYNPMDEQDTNSLILQEIQTHYKLLMHGVQSRFESVKGPDYQVVVNLVGIFIANVSYASPWTYNTTYNHPGSDTLVLSSDALSEFSSWVDMNKGSLPQFDHAMAFTANNLAHRENLQTLGVASQQSMCTERSLSMIEDHGNAAYASYIAAHELAHSLGAKHDGAPRTVQYNGRTTTCSAEDGFVMSPRTSSTPPDDNNFRSWRFSRCSQLYFDFYIDHLNSVNNNCLLHTGGTVRSHSIQTEPSPYTPDEQCSRVHGQGSVMNRVLANKNPGDICRSIPCTRPAGNSGTQDILPTLAMEGTHCGIGRVCQQGRCELNTGLVNWRSDDIASDECVFGDQPGIISNTNLTCEQLISKHPFNCYTHQVHCCESCRHHLRHQNVIPDCRYGDKIPGCGGTPCDDDMCCESCAVKTAVLQMCPDIEVPPFVIVSSNTKSYHHGTVLKFSCQNGFNLDGPTLIVCRENGTWSDNTPMCYIGCPKLVIPPGMELTLNTGNHSFGTIAHFRCIRGLELTGDATLLCLSSSVWNTSIPNCKFRFTSSEVIHIPEDAESGRSIYQLSTGNGESSFELIGISHRGFVVTKTGTILTDVSAEIDYEMVSEYRLHIKATLNIESRFQTTQVLRIIIDDVNEFEPVFEKPVYRFRVMADRNIDFITDQVKAIDRDASTTKITYSIAETGSNIDGNIIRLNSSTGHILISTASLQNLVTETLQFTVLASDDGLPHARTGSATVMICIGNPCSGNVPLSVRTSVFLVLVIHLRIVYPL